jgi:hypothetical protein
MSATGVLEAKAFLTDNPEQLREIVMELIEMVDERDRELETVKVDPAQNRALAHSVSAFAEWHTSGYGGDIHTFTMLAKQLWSEVAENVRAVTGRTAPLVGADPTQLGLFAEPGNGGLASARALQQSLFG